MCIQNWSQTAPPGSSQWGNLKIDSEWSHMHSEASSGLAFLEAHRYGVRQVVPLKPQKCTHILLRAALLNSVTFSTQEFSETWINRSRWKLFQISWGSSLQVGWSFRVSFFNFLTICSFLKFTIIRSWLVTWTVLSRFGTSSLQEARCCPKYTKTFTKTHQNDWKVDFRTSNHPRAP